LSFNKSYCKATKLIFYYSKFLITNLVMGQRGPTCHILTERLIRCYVFKVKCISHKLSLRYMSWATSFLSLKFDNLCFLIWNSSNIQMKMRRNRGQMNISNTYTFDGSLSCLRTCTSMKMAHELVEIIVTCWKN
jgi:hypothetical protein